jgi:hypothetical protein
MLEFYTENVCGSCGKRLPLTIISVYGEVNCGGGIAAETQLREFLEQLCVSSPLVLSSTPAESAAVSPEKLTALIEAELQRLMMENCREAPSASQLGPQLATAKATLRPPPANGCSPETHLKTSREMKESEA